MSDDEGAESSEHPDRQPGEYAGNNEEPMQPNHLRVGGDIGHQPANFALAEAVIEKRAKPAIQEPLIRAVDIAIGIR